MPAAPALMTERRPARAAERKGSCLRRMSSNHLRGGGGAGLEHKKEVRATRSGRREGGGEQGGNTRRRSGLPGKDGEVISSVRSCWVRGATTYWGG